MPYSIIVWAQITLLGCIMLRTYDMMTILLTQDDANQAGPTSETIYKEIWDSVDQKKKGNKGFMGLTKKKGIHGDY